MTTMNEPAPILEGEKLEQARARERTKVLSAIVGLLTSIAFLTLFTVTGAAAGLRDALGGNALVPTILFILVFQLISLALELPLESYFGYAEGKKYGIIKQNYAGWLVDHLKEFLVSTAIVSLLMLALYTVFRSFPTLWFPLALGLIAILFTVIMFISPKLARLNHKSSPINNPELETRIQNIFNKAGIALSKVSQLEVSEKNKGMNASLSPDGLKTEVIITDTLLQKIDQEGVEIVLAHELGHKVHRDVPALIVMSAAQIMITIAIAQVLFSSLGLQFGLQGASDIATLPLFMLAFTVVGQIASLFINAYKRRMEYRADRYALEITQNPAAFERAFRVLANENLRDPNPPEWVEVWLHDHPTIEKRLQAARAWATSSA
jgi:STE24 endopeptidase